MESVLPEYLVARGWDRSMNERRAVDAAGNPIPWLSYTAIDFLSERLQKHFVVFEYGSGGSTLWLAQRVKKLISIEHDQQWYEELREQVPGNVTYIYQKLRRGYAYCQRVRRYKTLYHVIFIDGRDRVRCAINSYRNLLPDGVIVWDNTDRRRYREGIHFLRAHGLSQLKLNGIGPVDPRDTQTSIFYRKDNCFEI